MGHAIEESSIQTSLRQGDLSATTVLTIYIVVLFAIPSNLTISALGSLGRPSMWCGLLLLAWWTFAKLQVATPATLIVRQPVRAALTLLVTIVLVSFAAAMLGGQPPDQVSPAVTSLLRLASWSGVLLVTMDGLGTTDDLVIIVRRLVVVTGLLALMGLAQFMSGDTLLGWLRSVPGLTIESSGIDSRADYTRAAATATHPLEYGAALIGVLPLALVTAFATGFPRAKRKSSLMWWLPVLLIALASVLSVSRSALIGLLVSMIASMPGMNRQHRWIVIAGGIAGAIGVAIIFPGIPQTMLNLFLGIGGDPSALSRSNALAQVPKFMATSTLGVLIGRGFGTFLPRYYIFDDQWVQSAIELGILGLMALLGIALTGIGSAITARRSGQSPEIKAISSAIAASLISICVVFAFFDGLAFQISAALYFLLAGLAGAALKVGRLESDNSDSSSRSGTRVTISRSESDVEVTKGPRVPRRDRVPPHQPRDCRTFRYAGGP